MAYLRNARKHAFTIFIAAELLSKRKYPKLPLNPLFFRNLKQFLTNNPLLNLKSKENFLKQHLLKTLTYHFEPKISADQHIVSLVKV